MLETDIISGQFVVANKATGKGVSGLYSSYRTAAAECDKRADALTAVESDLQLYVREATAGDLRVLGLAEAADDEGAARARIGCCCEGEGCSACEGA